MLSLRGDDRCRSEQFLRNLDHRFVGANSSSQFVRQLVSQIATDDDIRAAVGFKNGGASSDSTLKQLWSNFDQFHNLFSLNTIDDLAHSILHEQPCTILHELFRLRFHTLG